MRTFNIANDMYNTKIQFFIGDIDEKFMEETLKGLDPNFKITDINMPGNGAAAKCWDCGHNQVIWLSSDSIPLLAHELVHAAFHTADSIGFGDHYVSQEYHAYYIQWAINAYIELID